MIIKNRDELLSHGNVEGRKTGLGDLITEGDIVFLSESGGRSALMALLCGGELVVAVGDETGNGGRNHEFTVASADSGATTAPLQTGRQSTISGMGTSIDRRFGIPHIGKTPIL